MLVVVAIGNHNHFHNYFYNKKNQKNIKALNLQASNKNASNPPNIFFSERVTIVNASIYFLFCLTFLVI